VPAISNTVNDFLGIPQRAKPDKPDRAKHLYFLLFCYSSPLLLALFVGLFHMASARWIAWQGSSQSNENSPDSPFA
jgi:hypothetical protein